MEATSRWRDFWSLWKVFFHKNTFCHLNDNRRWSLKFCLLVLQVCPEFLSILSIISLPFLIGLAETLCQILNGCQLPSTKLKVLYGLNQGYMNKDMNFITLLPTDGLHKFCQTSIKWKSHEIKTKVYLHVHTLGLD